MRPAPVRIFRPKAKNVIFLFMPGGVSHMDSFDPKPKLAELDGKPAKLDSYVAGPKRKWLKSPWQFKTYGEIGLPVSELFPHITKVVDDLTVIRSMKSEFPLHARANVFLHTGRNFGGYPSLGSWVTYGLGSENKNLPGFLLLNHGDNPPGGMENFSNGFLPAQHQAMGVRAEGAPVDNLAPADDAADPASQDERRPVAGSCVFSSNRPRTCSGCRDLEFRDGVSDAVTRSRCAGSLEGAGVNQEALRPRLGERACTRLRALQCLRARRLVEAGVRFVEVTPPNLFGNNGTWDQHSDLKHGHETNAMVTDQGVAALVADLKSRGLLKETLIVWAGEFGRTPDTQNGDGRDHHPAGFTIWLAGGGARPGLIYGATDELGNEAVEKPMTVHDLHATILHLLGIDHAKLTFRFGGRDVTLPDVHGRVVKDVVA